MRHMLTIAGARQIAAAILCLYILTGCAGLDKTSYKTAATIEATADKAMMAWGDYVRFERAQPGLSAAELASQEAKVKEAYTAYRRVMNSVYAIRQTWKPDNTGGDYSAEINRAAQTAAYLLDLVNSFLPADRKVK